jgi:hypothetical protein
MRGNRNVGGCPSGGGGGENQSPKERYDLFFLSISPEPKIGNPYPFIDKIIYIPIFLG